MSARELITEHLELWTGAVTKKSSSGRGSNGKVELTGVKKLRELILQLAVMGKLVEQDTREESTQELLQHIALARSDEVPKKGKRQKLGPVENSEMAFTKPASWCWTRVGELAVVKGGKRLPKGHKLTQAPTSHAYIRVTDMKHGSVRLDDLHFISDETFQQIKKYTIAHQDLYITIAGTIGAIGEIPSQLDGANLTENAAKLVRIGNIIDKKFLKLVLSSTFAQAQFLDKVNQMAQPKLALHRIESTAIAIPPLKEQYRIVQKVDELMALCDRLEQQTSHQLEAHETLVDTLLGTLTQSENATELADNWARLAAHFDTLFTTEQSIDKLKQAILQLAVMGRLVEQDAEDDSAERALHQISVRQDETPKAILKKRAKLGLLSDVEIPFSLPKGWKWARFVDIALDYSVGLDKGKSQQSNNKQYRYFKMNNILNSGGYQLDDIVSVDATTEEVSRYALSSGDFLFNTRNSQELVGKTCVYNHDGGTPILYNNNILRAKFSTTETAQFIDIWMQSPEGKSKLEEIKSGTTNVWAIYQGKLETLPCPLPPHEEQRRIMGKVIELSALCDKLKEHLEQAGETRFQLVESLVEGALN